MYFLCYSSHVAYARMENVWFLFIVVSLIKFVQFSHRSFVIPFVHIFLGLKYDFNAVKLFLANEFRTQNRESTGNYNIEKSANVTSQQPRFLFLSHFNISYDFFSTEQIGNKLYCLWKFDFSSFFARSKEKIGRKEEKRKRNDAYKHQLTHITVYCPITS